MFFKGSRYRNLPQSANLTADGERLLGVETRLIPAVAGQFLHTVSEGDRLDLLAFKYYGDPKRWWLIADANRNAAEYPPDMLDRGPIIDEELGLVQTSMNGRVLALIDSLGQWGPAELAHADATRGKRILPDATPIVVRYGAGARASVIDEILMAGFSIIASFVWAHGSETAEMFTIADEAIKGAWSDLMNELARVPGVECAQSLESHERVHLVYDGARVSRDSILGLFADAGFSVVPELSRQAGRLGSRIVIPPNEPL